MKNPSVIPNVILAEDDNDDFFIFSLALEEMAIKTGLSRAEDGVALMQMLEVSIPDFVFIDLMMPRKDGITCIREIRGSSRYDGMCIIVYSALETLYHAQLCYQEKANAYIEKPSSVDSLIQSLQMVFTMDWKVGIPVFSVQLIAEKNGIKKTLFN